MAPDRENRRKSPGQSVFDRRSRALDNLAKRSFDNGNIASIWSKNHVPPLIHVVYFVHRRGGDAGDSCRGPGRPDMGLPVRQRTAAADDLRSGIRADVRRAGLHNLRAGLFAVLDMRAELRYMRTGLFAVRAQLFVMHGSVVPIYADDGI